jgi:hypothetical protein
LLSVPSALRFGQFLRGLNAHGACDRLGAAINDQQEENQ